MIPKIEFHINIENCEYILKGDIQKLLDDRRAKYYLLETLKGTFKEDGSIAIKYNIDEKEILLKSIQDAFIKYNVQQIESPEIKKVLKHYFVEKEKFKLFSEKAKKIWHNEIDLKEFKSFKESIEQNLPNRRLFDKQLLAAFHLAFSQNACNFSVPGAGKTSIVYAAFAFFKNLPENHSKYINKLIVIGPLNSFGPWEDEYVECFGKPIRSKRLSGGTTPLERERHLLSVEPIEEIPEVTLMSYQSVPNNIENLIHFLNRKDIKAMVVLDEAHRIKNTEGVWASSILSVAKYCKGRVVLTGTPLPNGYQDIYNLFEFIWPDKEITNFNIFQLKEMSERTFDPRIEQLIDNISPFFIRIKKIDLDLPPIEEHDPTYVKMSVEQREIYDFIENKYIGYFEKSENNKYASSELIKARFIRLMQVSTNPDLLRQPLERYFREQGLENQLFIDDSTIINKILNYKNHERIPRKLEVTKDLVVKLLDQNEKVVIWGIFIQNIKELHEYLKKLEIASEVLIGEIPVDNDDNDDDILTREKIIREFNSINSNFKVIIANPFAVSESISLHKTCHHAIYFERNFNAANYLQSKDRIHRVGLPKDIITHYHYVLSENSIDDTIHRRLIEKELRMLKLIESQEIPLISKNLDYELDLKDDIKAIIRDYVRRSAKA